MNGTSSCASLGAEPARSSTTPVVLSTSIDERDNVNAYELNVAGC